MIILFNRNMIEIIYQAGFHILIKILPRSTKNGQFFPT